MYICKTIRLYLRRSITLADILSFMINDRLHEALGYNTPAEVYGTAVDTPVALRAPSVPTALSKGDKSTLEIPIFCLDNG